VSDEGHASVPYKHETYQSAYDESIRLAKIKPSVRFSIFKYIGHSIAEQPRVSHHTYKEYPNAGGYWYTYPSPRLNFDDNKIPF
jgi:hypothetical protein